MLIDSYEWSGGREVMLRFGPDSGPVVVVALPLFEEANRVRAFAVTLCRLLAKRGVASVLPDVPGQGESLQATETVTLRNLRDGFAGAVEQLRREDRRAYAGSIRSGSIMTDDTACFGRWYLSPECGQHRLDELAKILSAAGRENDARTLRGEYLAEDKATPIEIAGNLIGAELRRNMVHDVGGYPLKSIGLPSRIVRLNTERAEANRHVPGTPLWRRAEPDNDPALAALLADDIAQWIATCEG